MLRRTVLLVALAVQIPSVAIAAERQDVVFDNERIRVTRHTLGPRDSVRVTSEKSLLYCLSSAVLTAKIGRDQERLVCDSDVAFWNESPFMLGHREGSAAELLVVDVKSDAGASAQIAEDDGSRVVPLAYGVMFENESLRVLRFRDNPGDQHPVHSHPGNLLRYSLTPLNARVISADGTVSTTNVDSGVAQWFAAGERHTWENNGTASEYAIIIEVK